MSSTAQRSIPSLSIVVVVYNMRREAPRTLYSLSTAYQKGVSAEDYEVIVVDNGSRDGLAEGEVRKFGRSFRYLFVEQASPSPAGAVNLGLNNADGLFVGIMVDGARLASPSVVRKALECLRHFERPVVTTLGFHLGPDIQTKSILQGYNQDVEDRLLAECQWERNGYRLFEICALAGSNADGWFGQQAESNLIMLPRTMCAELGGFDERFDMPGGGLVNLDFYRRVVEQDEIALISLLGEGTFHQVHGGTITNKPADEVPDIFRRYQEQYVRIRGEPFRAPVRRPALFGDVSMAALPWVEKSCRLLRNAAL